MTDNPRKIIKHELTRLLSKREHSQHELLLKLKSKGYCAETSENLLQEFAHANIQSDERFAEMLVRSRVNKGQGFNRIRSELNEHDISEYVLLQLERELEIDWFELAKSVAQKKYRSSDVSDWQQKQKCMRFMIYRGFTSEQANYAMECLASNVD